MCEFISWKGYRGKIWFLTDDIVNPRLAEFKEYNPGWQHDLPGHGAIEWFFNLPAQCGTNMECSDFTSPEHFPSEIVAALKDGQITYQPIPLGMLDASLDDDYEAKLASLDADYKAKLASLYDEMWELFKTPQNRVKIWQ